ncbi:MAG TPA: 2Fe-2S iron-sulfur cluster-binding protein, partial [Phnomibacter sp.]|nr:2Fe-2S iron-sulfur cluster-binding protein [Phnomibacter sp.]
MSTIPITVNGRALTASLNETILEVCRANDIEILTMCHLDGVSDVGACRLCLVEIEGNPKLMPACTTRVAPNMAITTTNEKLRWYQKITTELLHAERNHQCSVCVANGHCALQDLTATLEITHIRYPHLFPSCEVDASHPWFVLDHNRCIVCTRCVRVCAEVEGAFNWDVMNRGHSVRVISDFNTPWGESETCTSCGKCMHACPVGAIWPKSVSQGQLKKDPGMIAAL